MNTSNSPHSKMFLAEVAQALVYSDICIIIFLCLRLSGERSLHQTWLFLEVLLPIPEGWGMGDGGGQKKGRLNRVPGKTNTWAGSFDMN